MSILPRDASPDAIPAGPIQSVAGDELASGLKFLQSMQLQLSSQARQARLLFRLKPKLMRVPYITSICNILMERRYSRRVWIPAILELSNENSIMRTVSGAVQNMYLLVA